MWLGTGMMAMVRTMTGGDGDVLERKGRGDRARERERESDEASRGRDGSALSSRPGYGVAVLPFSRCARA
jgi:hypothetical protein